MRATGDVTQGGWAGSGADRRKTASHAQKRDGDTDTTTAQTAQYALYMHYMHYNALSGECGGYTDGGCMVQA